MTVLQLVWAGQHLHRAGHAGAENGGSDLHEPGFREEGVRCHGRGRWREEFGGISAAGCSDQSSLLLDMITYSTLIHNVSMKISTFTFLLVKYVSIHTWK